MTASSPVLPVELVPEAVQESPSSVTVPFRSPPVWKRTIDVIGSIVLMLLLAPLFALVAIYIKLVSRGPVLFRQERIGAGAENFVILKFRTMHVAENDQEHRRYIATLVDQDGPAVKPNYQSRLIPGGRILRSLSLDELPQLWNILRGQMSLVGPRPEVLELAEYEPWQLRRFEVLPGISGLWQVSGKNRLSFKQMIELDIRYVDGLSFKLDVRIILKTIRVVFLRDNQ